jgi:uncharacterized protein (DUF2249 family)
MSATLPDHEIDVRTLPPAHRHSTIFATWEGLSDGQALCLVNDHDPLPLYHQFAAEHEGTFRWDYLQAGPLVWRVRISKGSFSDPGYVPRGRPRAASCAKPVPVEFLEPFILDTRPYFDRNEAPCDAIDGAIARLKPGQKFMLFVPFEPFPLYAKLGNRGYVHHALQLDDGAWRVEFEPRPEC